MPDGIRSYGKIKMFKGGQGPGTGYGFIAPDDGDELFFHISNLVEGVNPDDLKEGLRVGFYIGEGQKGPVALDVDILDDNTR